MKKFLIPFLSLGLVLTLSACSEREAAEEASRLLDSGETTESSESSSENEAPEAQKAGFSYEAYSADRFAELKGNQPVALNFHADWCPTCRSLDKKIEADGRSTLPEDAVILKVDYDKEGDLKEEYEVTQQTTFIIFNAKGEQTGKEYNPSLAEMAELFKS